MVVVAAKLDIPWVGGTVYPRLNPCPVLREPRAAAAAACGAVVAPCVCVCVR